MAVVVRGRDAPGPIELDQVGGQLDELTEEVDEDVSELRVVSPNEVRYADATAELLAAEGYDLVCVVGPGSGEVVDGLAGTFPTTRFCALPASDDDPPRNVHLVDVRSAEVAFVAGVAAAANAPRRPPVLVTGRDQPGTSEQRAALRSGYRSGDGRGPVRILEVAPDIDEGDADVIAGRLTERQVASVHLDAGPGDGPVLEALDARGIDVLVTTGAGVLEAVEADLPTLGVRWRLDVLLRPVLDAVGDDDPAPASRGLVDEVLEIEPGPRSPRPAVVRAVRGAVERIVSGESGQPTSSPTVEEASPSPSPQG